MAFLASSYFVWNKNKQLEQKHQGEQDTDGQGKEEKGLKIKQFSMLQGMDCVLQW